MRRRDFITLLSAAATAWPVLARAQQPTMPVVGFLYTVCLIDCTSSSGFPQPTAESGYIEGRNVAIEYRWAQNQNEPDPPELAADLVGRRVTVIVTPASMPASLAAKAATATIPIVFSTGGDPVTFGLVASLNRPGGNVTGVVSFDTQLLSKRLGLLRDLLPTAMRFAVLVNPTTPIAESPDRGRAGGIFKLLGSSIEILTGKYQPGHRRRPLRALRKSGSTLLWSAPTPCSSTVRYNSSRWQPVSACQRSTPSTSLQMRGG